MKKLTAFFLMAVVSRIGFALDTPLKKLSKISKETELVKFQSYNVRNFSAIKTGRYKKSPIKVDALIAYPPKGEGPFPLVMIAHASGGPDQFNNKWFKFNRETASGLLKRGIAVMFLDNFSARGAKHTYADQSQVPLWSTYLDAFMALEYISTNPRVNIKKIGIHGWSRGGMISMMAAEKRVRDALISKELYFAAAQPRSPDCWSGGMFRNPLPIKETKIWMVLGGADDYTHAGPCVGMGQRIKKNGGDIEVTVKKGWGHGFTANYDPEYESDAQTFNDCPPWFMEDDGRSNADAVSFGHSCIKYGATMGGNKGFFFKPKFYKFWNETLLDLAGTKTNQEENQGPDK